MGPEHMLMLEMLNNLGDLYMEQGKLAKGKAMYERALARMEKTLGPEHKWMLLSVDNLGNRLWFRAS